MIFFHLVKMPTIGLPFAWCWNLNTKYETRSMNRKNFIKRITTRTSLVRILLSIAVIGILVEILDSATSKFH